MVWYGMVWYGLVWYGMVWYGMGWYGMVWYGMVWYGMVWDGMVWYGMVWYGMVWYGMVWYGSHRSHAVLQGEVDQAAGQPLAGQGDGCPLVLAPGDRHQRPGIVDEAAGVEAGHPGHRGEDEQAHGGVGKGHLNGELILPFQLDGHFHGLFHLPSFHFFSLHNFRCGFFHLLNFRQDFFHLLSFKFDFLLSLSFRIEIFHFISFFFFSSDVFNVISLINIRVKLYSFNL